jgi:hypothetical protein
LFSNISILSVPDEGYSRNVLCVVNLISLFLLQQIYSFFLFFSGTLVSSPLIKPIYIIYIWNIVESAIIIWSNGSCKEDQDVKSYWKTDVKWWEKLTWDVDYGPFYPWMFSVKLTWFDVFLNESSKCFIKSREQFSSYIYMVKNK